MYLFAPQCLFMDDINIRLEYLFQKDLIEIRFTNISDSINPLGNIYLHSTFLYACAENLLLNDFIHIML